MSIKKQILLSLLIAFLLALIPIQRYDRIGFECAPGREIIDGCIKKLPSHGFPIVIVDTTPFESPIGVIDWDIETFIAAIPPFIINWLIVFLVIIITTKIHKKIKSANKV